MKLLFYPLLTILFLPSGLLAQSDSSVVVFTNSMEVQSGRHEGVIGSPYLFEDFVLANIVSSNIDVYDNIAVNYNGHTKGFEARKGRKIIELDERWYLRVEVNPETNPGLIKDFGNKKLIFQRGIHPKLGNAFAQVLYTGAKMVFAKTYNVSLSKNKIEDVGKTREVQRFRGKYIYYIIKNGQLHTVSLRKKSIIKALGNAKEIEKFTKENNINFKSEADLIKIIDFYDKNL